MEDRARSGEPPFAPTATAVRALPPPPAGRGRRPGGAAGLDGRGTRVRAHRRPRRRRRDGWRAPWRPAVGRAQPRRGAGGAGAPASPAAWTPPGGSGRAIPALTLRAYREAAAWAVGYDLGCR